MRWAVIGFLFVCPAAGSAAWTPTGPTSPIPPPATSSPAAIQLAQSCVCHNPVGAAGDTLCRRQRIVRCRANTRNQCSWEETNDRC